MNYTDLKSHFKIAKEKNNNVQAYCPVHEDKNASLSITFTNDKALIFCHAGCLIEDILKAVNLTFSDLYPNGNKPIGIYQYRNPDNTLSHEKVKFKAPPPKNKEFFQRHIENDQIVDNLDGVKRIPYNYPDIIKAIKSNCPILYCEGEKDANTAKLLGYVSTTMGGASDWKDEYKHYFKGATVIQIPDKDEPGLKLAHNVTESLKSVANSLKVVILPGDKEKVKDLTNWVEQGNRNLQPLIDQSTELITDNWLSNLVMDKTNSGYSFKLVQLDLVVLIERLTNELEGIIKVCSNNRIIYTSKINLLSPRTLTELATRLKHIKDIKWEDLLAVITNRCSEIISDAGDIHDISIEPINMEINYLLYPLLPKDEPTTIYTAGGKGKSIFCDYFSVLVTYGINPEGLPFITKKSNVLYLDWEADLETHRRYITAIKRGMGLEHLIPIYYRNLEYPLAQSIDNIKMDIEKWEIGLVIIDSQMAATASGTRGMTEAQVASEYYNLLRSFRCTTLTIDHVTKTGMSADGGAEAPFGSVVKYNRSRSQFELRLPEDEEDSDHKEYALVHKKFNLGKKQRTLGIAVDFENNGNELISIKFSGCDMNDSPTLSKILPQWMQIQNVLKQKTGLTATEISSEINNDIFTTKRVSDILGRYSKIFKQDNSTSKKWYLIDNTHVESPKQSQF